MSIVENFCGFRIEKHHGWTWYVSGPDILENWFDHYRELEKHFVKRNPVRCVFRAVSSSGAEYFVKHDRPHGFTGRIRAWFQPKGKSEMSSFLLLRSRNVPCAEYVAYGWHGTESMLVTKALKGYRSCLEYWYTEAAENPDAS